MPVTAIPTAHQHASGVRGGHDEDDDEADDGDDKSRAEALRLRAAIDEAIELRDELQQKNVKLQRRLASILQKSQADSSSSSSTQASTTTDPPTPQQQPPANGRNARHDDKSSANENEKRYLECLRSVHEAKTQTAAAQTQYDRIALDLQAKLDEKEAKVTEIQDSFLEFKREIAKNAENTRTGKPIAARVIAQFEAAELKKDQEVEKIRLKHINLRTHLKKLEQQLHAKEQLAEGLHLIDFEQLKIENQTLNEKIEERNEELHKLRKKTTATVQVLTHIKEKLQFLLAENHTLKKESAELEEALNGNRDKLAKRKKERDANRTALHNLKSKDGFAQSELLIEDYEKREADLVDLQRRLGELMQRHAYLTKVLTNK